MKIQIPLTDKTHRFKRVSGSVFRCTDCKVIATRTSGHNYFTASGTEEQLAYCSKIMGVPEDYKEYVIMFEPKNIRLKSPIFRDFVSIKYGTICKTIPAPINKFRSGSIFIKYGGREIEILPEEIDTVKFEKSSLEISKKVLLESKPALKLTKKTSIFKQLGTMQKVLDLFCNSFLSKGKELSVGYKEGVWHLYTNDMWNLSDRKFLLLDRVLRAKYKDIVVWKLQYLHSISRLILLGNHRYYIYSKVIHCVIKDKRYLFVSPKTYRSYGKSNH